VSIRAVEVEEAMILSQFTRYVLIGLLLNAPLYGSYLWLSHTWTGSRGAMSVTYCAGVLLGFVLNRKITFGFRGDQVGALARYIASYGIGYAIDFAGLWLLVERGGFRHEWVQAFLTIAIAVMLFALQRYWVFSPSLPMR
jgi:putative flippase GtrA